MITKVKSPEFLGIHISPLISECRISPKSILRTQMENPNLYANLSLICDLALLLPLLPLRRSVNSRAKAYHRVGMITTVSATFFADIQILQQLHMVLARPISSLLTVKSARIGLLILVEKDFLRTR